MRLIPIRKFKARGRNARDEQSEIVCHAIVSDEDYDRLSAYRWTLHKRIGRKGTEYPRRSLGGRGVFMHSEVLAATDGKEVSHKDSNPLNNQRDNLELLSRSRNRINRNDLKRSDNKTGVRGLWWDDKRSAFQVYVTVDKKRIRAGRFASKTEAVAALSDLLNRYELPAPDLVCL